VKSTLERESKVLEAVASHKGMQSLDTKGITLAIGQGNAKW